MLHNMRLVAHVAKKYVSSEEEQEDLISIGTIGLMKAVDSFRPEYGNKFATYAIRCVDNELLMHLRSKKKQRKEVSMFEPIGTDKEGNQIQLVDVLEFHDKNVADEVTKREQMKKICTFMNDVLSEREAFYHSAKIWNRRKSGTDPERNRAGTWNFPFLCFQD